MLFSFIVLIGIQVNACNIFDTMNQIICPEDSFLFNGVYLKTAGTYYDTLNISPGCDTFRTLHLSIHPTIAPTLIRDSFCSGQSYSYNSKTYTVSGTFFDTLASVHGCDSTIVLDLMYKYQPLVFPPPRKDTVDSFCRGYTFYFEGKPYSFNTSGAKVIRDTIFGGAANGCDSINQRFVFIRNNNSSGSWFTNRFACRPYRIVQKDFYNPSVNRLDTTFTTNGIKSIVFQNRFGCDSTVTFFLQLRDTSTTTLNRTTCSDQPYFFNGEWLGGGVTTETYFERRDTLTQTVNGPGGNTARCDSFITLKLWVYPVKHTTIDTALCENHFYYFKGQNRNTAGVYRDTLVSSRGCDSFVTLNLTIRRTSRFTYFRKFCSNEPVFFNNTNIEEAGTYMDTLVNAVGCDSFLTMVLTKDTINTVTIDRGICSYDSFYFGGSYRKTAGTYTATFKNKSSCDSIVTLNLTIYPFRTITLVKSNSNILQTDSGYSAYYWYFNDWTQLNATGRTIAANNIGSYHVVAQDSNQCKFKSNVVVYNPAGISEASQNIFKIYPVPTSDILHIESNIAFDKDSRIILYSLDGKLVLSQSVLARSNRFLFDLSSIAKGNYILHVRSGNTIVERKIEKQ